MSGRFVSSLPYLPIFNPPKSLENLCALFCRLFAGFRRYIGGFLRGRFQPNALSAGALCGRTGNLSQNRATERALGMHNCDDLGNFRQVYRDFAGRCVLRSDYPDDLKSSLIDQNGDEDFHFLFGRYCTDRAFFPRSTSAQARAVRFHGGTRKTTTSKGKNSAEKRCLFSSWGPSTAGCSDALAIGTRSAKTLTVFCQWELL